MCVCHCVCVCVRVCESVCVYEAQVAMVHVQSCSLFAIVASARPMGRCKVR